MWWATRPGLAQCNSPHVPMPFPPWLEADERGDLGTEVEMEGPGVPKSFSGRHHLFIRVIHSELHMSEK